MRWMLVVGFLALTGCGPHLGDDRADCITKFAVPAKTTLGARGAYGFCGELHDRTPSPERRRFIECALPAMRDAGTDLGARGAIQQCNNP